MNNFQGNLIETITLLKKNKKVNVVSEKYEQPVSDDTIECISLLERKMPPKKILDIYKVCDGISLVWGGLTGDDNFQGSINIVSCMESSLRGPQNEGGEPLEDVVWVDEHKESFKKEVKQMAIFENIAGQEEYLMFYVGDESAKLYYVGDEVIRPLYTDFETTIELLAKYAGAWGLREHLTHKDWQKRIENDKILKYIVELSKPNAHTANNS